MSTSNTWVSEAAAAKKEMGGFPVDSRLHISLNVSDIKQSVEFYRIFFGEGPIKVKPGYVKFDLHDPPLNFSLNEFPENTAAQGHLGVQVKNTKFIREAFSRFEKAGLKLTGEDGVECCYAVQTKFWVADPDGNRWELFVTTEPDAEEGCGPECICHKEIERSYVAAS